jgi:Domain of unknown function (DUF4864)
MRKPGYKVSVAAPTSKTSICNREKFVAALHTEPIDSAVRSNNTVTHNGGCTMLKLTFNLIARLLVIVVLGFSLTSFARAASDQDEIKTVIESQLNAFAIDNGNEALSYAAPIVKQIFKTPEQFMAMVKQGYQPVYRNSNRIFGDVFQDGLGRPAMRVVLTGADGKRYEALYAMEEQADGTWKIAGCVILAIPAQEV